MGIFASKQKPIVCDQNNICINIDTISKDCYRSIEPPHGNHYYEPLGYDTRINILKYRVEPNNTDTKYASLLLSYYNKLPIHIQNKFNSLTDNLMACESINQSCLLNAIRDFEDTVPNLNDYRSWIIFTDTAFYYKS